MTLKNELPDLDVIVKYGTAVEVPELGRIEGYVQFSKKPFECEGVNQDHEFEIHLDERLCPSRLCTPIERELMPYIGVSFKDLGKIPEYMSATFSVPSQSLTVMDDGSVKKDRKYEAFVKTARNIITELVKERYIRR